MEDASGSTTVHGFFTHENLAGDEPMDLNRLLVKQPLATYFMKVEGTALEAAGIAEGDFLIVDRSRTPKEGDIIVLRESDGFSLQILRAANGPVSVFGVVSASIRRY